MALPSRIPESGGVSFNPPAAEMFDEFKMLDHIRRGVRPRRRRYRTLSLEIRHKRYSWNRLSQHEAGHLERQRVGE